MNRTEQRIIDWIDKHKEIIFCLIISVIAAQVRLYGLDFHSGDYDGYLRPWYDTIKANGGFSGLSQQVGNYSVLYQVCIAVMTYLPIHPLTAYKGLSVLFDYLLAACAGYIVYDMSDRDKVKAAAGYGCVLMLPSVFFNSAYWAQCDAIYSFFSLMSVLCVIKKRDLGAILCAALAFQFKLQSVFLFPFLFIYYIISRRFTILYFLLIPLLSVPICLLCGRAPFDLLKIYFEQTGQHTGMTLTFPSIWNLISDNYDVYGHTAVLVAVAAIGLGILLVMKAKPEFNKSTILNLAIWSVWTCVMFLPNMHERYAFFLNILVLIAAAVDSKRIGTAVLLEILTLIMYAKLFFGGTAAYSTPMYLCTAAYLAAYIHFCMRNFPVKRAFQKNE